MVTKKTTGTSKAATAKPAAASTSAPEAEADAPVAKAERGPSLRTRDLVDKVAAATGGKKKGVKEIVEATLSEIGAALTRGEDLNLPGFGRARVVRTADRGGASMLTLKLRMGGQKPKGEASSEALAEDGEDS